MKGNSQRLQFMNAMLGKANVVHLNFSSTVSPPYSSNESSDHPMPVYRDFFMMVL